MTFIFQVHKIPLIIFILLMQTPLFNQETDMKIPFEKNPNITSTYFETIAFYEALAKEYPNQLQLDATGSTDSGHPLHVAILSVDGDFSPAKIRDQEKQIIFINNAIHPGEPCGVDASMMLIRDYLQDKSLQQKLEHVVLVVIPFYNIGGGLNRGGYSRANQDGPVAHGFRGNARNLDLNRDFIKCDSKNATIFNQVYNYWNPDVFIDNHTSNGADYQYTMTLIPTQHNKLDQHLAGYLQSVMLPDLYKEMEAKKWEMVPYVYARSTPDEGIAGFLDLPRYSSGYAALHHALAFIPETHMLKPYKDRVLSTYAFMESVIEIVNRDYQKIGELRKKAIDHFQKTKTHFDLNWTIEMNRSDTISFKGYEAGYKPSEVSGLDRLYYDRSKPYTKAIPHFNYYKSTLSVQKPKAYIIPQAYTEVIDRLQWNGAQLSRLGVDMQLDLEMYYIEDYKTTNTAYEGHFLHSNVKVKTKNMKWQYHKGDYVVFTDQPANRYLIETLEPQGPDSFFAWNFFDGILMQKEYFSSYVFEDLAAEFLKQHPKVREALEAKKKEDEEFAKSARAQLDFVYRHSPYYEPTHNLYPVGRLMKDTDLLLMK